MCNAKASATCLLLKVKTVWLTVLQASLLDHMHHLYAATTPTTVKQLALQGSAVSGIYPIAPSSGGYACIAALT